MADSVAGCGTTGFFVVFIFFFQAEDGIRDGHVTGVQTCALPIYLDTEGLEGRALRRVQTDLDRWHWENLDLPPGVRTGPFRHTVRTAEPVEATVRFGPDGVEGRVTPGPFGRIEDALLSTPGRHVLAARLGA